MGMIQAMTPKSFSPNVCVKGSKEKTCVELDSYLALGWGRENYMVEYMGPHHCNSIGGQQLLG